MKIIKVVLKGIIGIFLIPIFYIAVSLILTFIPVNRRIIHKSQDRTIYISSNGVHLDIVIPVTIIDSAILCDLEYNQNDNYLSFGWGDRNFYLNTPEWSDLTFKTAFTALFLRSESLVHLTRYSYVQQHWVEIKVNQHQLSGINLYILNTFSTDSTGEKVLLKNRGYYNNDDFYEANGFYTCFKSSNSWVNSGLRRSDIKACLWTPFDFGLIRLHKEKGERRRGSGFRVSRLLAPTGQNHHFI